MKQWLVLSFRASEEDKNPFVRGNRFVPDAPAVRVLREAASLTNMKSRVFLQRPSSGSPGSSFPSS